MARVVTISSFSNVMDKNRFFFLLFVEEEKRSCSTMFG
jgi:hypothetical protein